MFATLHDELHAYLDGLVLEHPLVQCDFACPALYGRLNRLYEHRLAVQAGRHTPNAWDRFHPELSVDERLMRFMMHDFAAAQPAERLKFFGEFWTAPDVLAQSSSICDMFLVSVPDTSAVMTPEEQAVHAALPETIRVYRGHHRLLLDGCCWYPDREAALAWAVGVPGNGSLSSGTVRREHVRAVFTRRGETELIVRWGQVADISTKSYLPGVDR